MGRIRVLPESVINTIAAGEVVERPASAVKELLENSIDAGSTSISIRLEEGGRRLVQVQDDGCGMDPDDAVSALERHATSKLSRGMALEKIETLGFRGEALPSIAAVSRLTLTTASGSEGTRVEVEGGAIRSSGPAPHPRGTTISVADLFFNTPARRRFLRSQGTEMGHILELFTAVSLSRPEIRFRLEHGKRRIFDLARAGDVRSRLSQMEGAEAAREAIEIRGETPGCAVSGYLIPGRGARQQKGRRLLVNGRVVRDRLILGALARAVDEILPRGTPTTCFLALQLPHELVDVNVHPAKAEVRFREPGAVYRSIQSAVTGALRSHQHIRTVPDPSGEPRSESVGGPATPAEARESIESAARRWSAGTPGGQALWEPRPSGVAEPVQGEGSALPRGEPVVVGHYRTGYILAEDDDGLVIVDQHAAHERILFEALGEREARGEHQTQALLFPRTVQPPAPLRGDTAGLVEDLIQLGFDAEEFGESTIMVRGVPAPLSEADPESLIAEVLASAGAEGAGKDGIEGRRRRMVATAACHAAVKVPARLTAEKLQWILQGLLKCRAPLQCPHGRPTILRWTHRELERRFGRP